MKSRTPLRLLLSFFIYTVSSVLLLALVRLLLWVFNTNLFPPADFGTVLQVVFGGFVFDFSTFCMLHLIFIPFLLVPYHILQHRFFRIFTSILVCLAGFLLIAPSITDVIYYRFTLKRTTFDVFNFLGTMENEIGGLSLRFLVDFWYMLLVFAVLFAGFIILTRKTLFSKKFKDLKLSYKWQLPAALIFTFILLSGGRGSFDMRPLGILHASKVAGPEYAPLVVNSTYTLIKTYGKKDLDTKTWFSKEELPKIFNPVHYYYNYGDSVKQFNVILIISESLSAEHCGFLNKGLETFTPFLDSLSKQSLVFSNMYANGKRSLDGIPAIVSSLPPLMQNPFVTSMYSGNEIEGIGKLLVKAGYESSFFHGGYNGTMNFDGYAATAGYKNYFGKNEYPGPESDFDGRWGIFDEPFLQFMSSKCSSFSQPFTTCVFTLSAHHPYTIPSALKNKFPRGPKPIHETIAYADYSLQQFFAAASKTSWYNNTLFIITADHTSELYSDCFVSVPSNHAIPMIWFNPGDTTLKGQSDVLCQQTDILPSLADYLNLNDTVIAFGNSVFDTTAIRFALMMNDVMYQMLASGFQLLEFNGEDEYRQSDYLDCRLNNGPVESPYSAKENLKLLKAIIQQFNNRAIENKLSKP